MQILLEKKAVEIVRDTTSLQPDFLSEEENRPFFFFFFSSHYKPIIAQQNDEGRLLSNGNCGLHSESYSSRGLGSFYRLYEHIPPYSYSSSVSQVPEIFPRRHYITISGASIRNLNSAFRFYNLDGDCGGTYSISRTKHSPIFRRLACPSSFAGVPTVRPFTSLGNHYKSGSNTKSSEIRPSSISGLRVCRNEVPDSHWHCQSSRRESSKFLSFYFGFYRFNSLPPENFCPCWDHSMLQQI